MRRLVVLACAALVLWLLPIARSADRPPNIIFILADDLSYWDLSCFGQQHFSTPRIDRLALEGRVFTMAYAAGPWCAPSRTGVLTGRRPVHFGPAREGAGGRAAALAPTVAEALKAAGYATAALGKWHMFDQGDTWQLPGKNWEEQKANTNWALPAQTCGMDVFPPPLGGDGGIPRRQRGRNHRHGSRSWPGEEHDRDLLF